MEQTFSLVKYSARTTFHFKSKNLFPLDFTSIFAFYSLQRWDTSDKIIIFILILFLIILVLEKIGLAWYGTRPMGMGGAFTGLADDANAQYWNPAGLAINPAADLSLSTLVTNRNQKIGDNFASFKWCKEKEGVSPFEVIPGIGIISVKEFDFAKFLSNALTSIGNTIMTGIGNSIMNIIIPGSGTESSGTDNEKNHKGWGRPEVKKFKREESMAEEVKKKGNLTTVPDTSKTSPISPSSIYLSNQNKLWHSSDYQRPTNREDRKEIDQSGLKGKGQFAIGIGWLMDNNALLDQNTNWYILSLASGWEETAAFGASLNIYNLTIPSVNIKGNGSGYDVGLLMRPTEKLSFGLCIKEFLTTDIHWQNDAATRYEMLVNAGIAIKPIKEVTLAADIHDAFRNSQTFHYGIEIKPISGVAFRAGLYNGSKTAGLSIGGKDIIIDYAYLGGEFNRTHMAGITIRL